MNLCIQRMAQLRAIGRQIIAGARNIWVQMTRKMDRERYVLQMTREIVTATVGDNRLPSLQTLAIQAAKRTHVEVLLELTDSD